jgi:hypothetical protein
VATASALRSAGDARSGFIPQIALLVHSLRALHDEHAPLSFKQPRYGLPGKAGQFRYLSNRESRFLSHWFSSLYLSLPVSEILDVQPRRTAAPSGPRKRRAIRLTLIACDKKSPAPNAAPNHLSFHFVRELPINSLNCGLAQEE